MPLDTTELDSSLVSIFKESERAQQVYAETLEALSLIPGKLKQQLRDCGVRIVLTPTIYDILPELQDLDADALCKEMNIESQDVEKYARGWPVLYEVTTKIIYVGQKSQIYRGNTIAYNVLNRCGFALCKVQDLMSNADLLEAFRADYDVVPGDLIPRQLRESGEFFAAMFACVLMSRSGNDAHDWATGMVKVYPNMVAIVTEMLNEYS